MTLIKASGSCISFIPRTSLLFVRRNSWSSPRRSGFHGPRRRLVAGSTDNEYSHQAWRKAHPDLKDLPYPMIAAQKLAFDLGIVQTDANACLRQRSSSILITSSSGPCESIARRP